MGRIERVLDSVRTDTVDSNGDEEPLGNLDEQPPFKGAVKPDGS